MLDEIRKDPAMGEDIIESADYLRVELHQAAVTEIVAKLEDFLRRRSKITQVVSEEEILGSPGSTKPWRSFSEIELRRSWTSF